MSTSLGKLSQDVQYVLLTTLKSGEFVPVSRLAGVVILEKRMDVTSGEVIRVLDILERTGCLVQTHLGPQATKCYQITEEGKKFASELDETQELALIGNRAL